MSNADERAAIADGFRRLRPVIHAWLARDLAGTPAHEPTRAYADLTLAFGFARLGEVADAKHCATDADAILSASAHEAHHWLLRLYRYRINEALRGNRHGGIVPEGVRTPIADEIDRLPNRHLLLIEAYAADRLQTLSRVLNPEQCVDPYEGVMTRLRPEEKPIARLRHLTTPDRLAAEVRAFLADADSDAAKRLVAWNTAFPFVRRGNVEFARDLAFAVPEVLRTPADQSSPEWWKVPARLFQSTVELVAELPDPEPFPPLVGAGVGIVRTAPGGASRHSLLAQITWPCLQWFRKLDPVEESAAYLHQTRDLWPLFNTRAEWESLSEDSRFPALHARLAQAACASYCGQDELMPSTLHLAGEVLTGWQYPRGRTKDLVEVVISFSRALALIPHAQAFSTLEQLLPELTQISNTWQTAQFYSRFHFQIIEAAVLAFPPIGDF